MAGQKWVKKDKYVRKYNQLQDKEPVQIPLKLLR
jgi:hypothetical protein